MKTLLTFVALFCLAAGAGFAQPIDPDPNGIGIYFDPSATIVEGEALQYVPFHVYVVATNIECDGLQAFEFTFEMQGAAAIIQAATHQGTNFGTAPEYIVGTGTPLPFSPAIVLVDFNLIATTSDRIDFYLSPLSVPSIEGACCYADGQDEMHLVALHPACGSWEYPQAVANGYHPWANESKSWAEVKVMFR